MFDYVNVLSSYIQLSRGEDWDLINRFNIAVFFMPVPSQNWISNVICRGLFLSSMVWAYEVVVRFVDIGEIVDHRRLNFLFIIHVHVFSGAVVAVIIW
jgi:hypothetical protein